MHLHTCLYHFSLELELQAPVCLPTLNLIPSKCILSNLAKPISQKCKYVHAAMILRKIRCPLIFLSRFSFIWPPKPPTSRLPPLLPSSLLPLTYLLCVQTYEAPSGYLHFLNLDLCSCFSIYLGLLPWPPSSLIWLTLASFSGRDPSPRARLVFPDLYSPAYPVQSVS